MGIWDEINRNELSLPRLWGRLDQGTREAAAKSLYEHDWEDGGVRVALADLQVASALRSRPVAVRKLPVERRIRSVALVTRPPADLVSSLLTAFHLESRRDLMKGFLDALEIPHHDGLVDAEHEVRLTDEARVAGAIDGLFKNQPEDQVELYLATLYLSDPKTWGLVAAVMKGRGANKRV